LKLEKGKEKMKLASLTAAALLAFATSANAAVNLVANPGFETGDFTGWTVSAAFVANDPPGAYAGNYYARIHLDFPYDFISQNIPTTAGHTYQIDYYLKSQIGGEFHAEWNGSQVFGTSTSGQTFDYTLYSFQLPATSASTLLEFQGWSEDGNYALDNVSVIDVTPVPEPASLSILAIGAVAILRRKTVPRA
jgi:hypothetical protein